MPKIVDNYVLERKIGSGQFGEVFKGYNKITNVDIAIKSVKRELLKGKFHELLENEIKVLRSCNNDNIIKLYDLKKTQNNIYLILEYCNEGDLNNYLKSRKYITEDEAVEYLLQILNAFKTLVKSKIMHRDFKLANILKHNGNIKIADFGFSKLLGNDSKATTMLGSPLNMAPEILNGTEYDNKADIWSIGTVFYELLFGRSPFMAGNMIDLLKNIKTKSLEIPRKINNISEVVEDVLRKMLTVDPADRIEWEDLFTHKITSYQEEKLKKELETTLKCSEFNLSMNMSRFYIKNNMVIAHPSEINKKEELNNYAIQVARQAISNDQKPAGYQGALIKRQTEREEEKLIVEKEVPKIKSPEKMNEGLQENETMREVLIRVCKRNSNRILHERNIYVFLASVAEDAMNSDLKISEYVGFLLVKKLLILIDGIKYGLQTKNNMFSLDQWEHFTSTKDYLDIYQYIAKEYDVFKVYFDQLYERMQPNLKKNTKLENDLLLVLNNNLKDGNLDKNFRKILVDYLKSLIHQVVNTKFSNEEARFKWSHANRILDCMRLEEVFRFEDNNKMQFNFKIYYDESNRYDIETLIKFVENKMKELKIML